MLEYTKLAEACKDKIQNLSDEELVVFAKETIDECFVSDPCDIVPSEGRREEMDTLGNLVDKLAIVTVRMWHAQDDLYRYRRMSTEEWQAEFAGDPDRVRHTLVRACELNLQRNQLMDEIDKLHLESLSMDEEEKQKLSAPKHKQY